MIEERDIPVVMRDGTRLVLDVYRPDATGRYPVLYACSLHNKDIQGPDIADVLPPQPAHAPLWFGPIEAGNTRHFIANGYVHVIAQPRGSAKSEGQYGHEDTDHYDIIEWITRQPWCDGNVGMVGISGYAGEQWRAAAQGHPALKAIFPYDACSAYGGMFGFRDFVPGGVLHTFPYLLDVFSTVHESRDRPLELPPDQENLWREAMRNPDFKQYVNLYNILTQKGQRTFLMYHLLTSPWEADGVAERSDETFKKIKIPFYTGSGAYAYTYKLHWLGAQHYFQNVEQPKKLIFTGPAHTEAPLGSEAGAAVREPDVFTQMPLTRTVKVERLRYMTDPLPRDVDVVGPIVLTLYAAIDQNDTNWIVVLKDVGPDVSVRTAREGERAVPQNLPERELTRGWLKASYRAVDEKRSKPWEPFHKLTRAAVAPVVPGEVVEYRIQILGTANRFKAGHRICLDITSMDVPTGTGAMTNVEYIPYHVCSSQTVTHRIYRDAERPSHLLLPIIPV
jgi:predicted acyl esterase